MPRLGCAPIAPHRPRRSCGAVAAQSPVRSTETGRLKFEKEPLCLLAEGISRERSIGPDNAVAGHDKARRIGGVGASYRARRASDDPGHIEVGAGLPVGNPADGVPDTALEKSAA